MSYWHIPEDTIYSIMGVEQGMPMSDIINLLPKGIPKNDETAQFFYEALSDCTENVESAIEHVLDDVRHSAVSIINNYIESRNGDLDEAKHLLWYKNMADEFAHETLFGLRGGEPEYAEIHLNHLPEMFDWLGMEEDPDFLDKVVDQLYEVGNEVWNDWVEPTVREAWKEAEETVLTSPVAEVLHPPHRPKPDPRQEKLPHIASIKMAARGRMRKEYFKGYSISDHVEFELDNEARTLAHGKIIDFDKGPDEAVAIISVKLILDSGGEWVHYYDRDDFVSVPVSELSKASEFLKTRLKNVASTKSYYGGKGRYADKDKARVWPVYKDEDARDEDAVANVFGLTGGELSNNHWGGYALNYEGSPDYAKHDLEELGYEYHTVLITGGGFLPNPKERIVVEGVQWDLVQTFMSSGETDCPVCGAGVGEYWEENFEDTYGYEPHSYDKCGLCESEKKNMPGYIYVGEGYEAVYRTREENLWPEEREASALPRKKRALLSPQEFQMREQEGTLPTSYYEEEEDEPLYNSSSGDDVRYEEEQGSDSQLLQDFFRSVVAQHPDVSAEDLIEMAFDEGVFDGLTDREWEEGVAVAERILLESDFSQDLDPDFERMPFEASAASYRESSNSPREEKPWVTEDEERLDTSRYDKEPPIGCSKQELLDAINESEIKIEILEETVNRSEWGDFELLSEQEVLNELKSMYAEYYGEE